ncbi:14116_t:CDS:1, partial [Funneliformis geosporum]
YFYFKTMPPSPKITASIAAQSQTESRTYNCLKFLMQDISIT